MRHEPLTSLGFYFALMVGMTGSAWAEDPPRAATGGAAAIVVPPPGRPRPPERPRPPRDTPELDAASGTSAIVLLSGALLLIRERSRSRRRA